MKRMQHPTAIARWLFFVGLAIVATLTSASATNAAALSYADMYYKVEVATPSTTANFTTAEHQGGGRWWEMASSRRSLTRIATVPVECTAALSTLAEPFSMDFFGIRGGGHHGLSPFIDGYSGIISMTPHRPCMPTHRSACATLTYGGGMVTEAQCRSQFGLNASTQVPNEPKPTSGNDSGNNKNQTSDNPTSYETFRMRNIGIPWTAISLFGEKMYSHTTAAWTDASKCCLVLLVNTATADSSSVWNGGRLRGEVELCRNGTVTLRYEEVPFVPPDRRANVLARCLRLAESNSTDPDFILVLLQLSAFTFFEKTQLIRFADE